MIRQLVHAASSALGNRLALIPTAADRPRGSRRACIETLENRRLFSVSYDLVELTLGGSMSRANDVNALGQVVGYSDLANGDSHAFFYDGATLLDLGTLGGTSSNALAVNDSGQVIGDSTLVGDNLSHGFFWSDGSLVDLTLGGSFSDARFINNNGQVVGQSTTTGDDFWLAYIYFDGTITPLSLGSDSIAVELTSTGFVIGNGQTTDGAFTRAFLFDGSRIIELASSGDSQAHDVNEHGQVVGSFTVGGVTHAFVYSGGVLTDLGTLGGSSSVALKINDAGDILGESTTVSGKVHAFHYRNGVMTDLGALGSSGSDALALNEAGQILIESRDAAGFMHALLWTGGSLADLGVFRGSSNSLVGLTDSGLVFGEAYTASFLSKSFVYSQGTLTDIAPATAQNSLIAFNNAGQALIEAGDYYLYSDGLATRLEDLAAGSSAWDSIDFASTLGDQGHVLGYGTIGARSSAWVASPIVISPNAAPSALDDAVETNADTAVVIDVLANDSDTDGDPLTITEAGPAAHGVVVISADGKLRYTPSAGYFGVDSFAYTVSDGQGGIATANVTVTIKAPPPAPKTVTDLTNQIDKLLAGGMISKKAADQLSQPIDLATKQLAKAKPNVELAIRQLQKTAEMTDLLPAAERDAFIAAIEEIIAGLA